MSVLVMVRSRVERFDVLTGGVIALLVALIGAVILNGDQAGVSVTLLSPGGDALIPAPADLLTVPYRSTITLRFSEPMDPRQVSITLEPPVAGQTTWSGAQWTFTPDTAFAAGQRYTVRVRAGSASTTGRTVRGDRAWGFAVRQPSIVYLAPAIHPKGSEQTNLFRVLPPGKPEQLTNSPYGIEDFAPSPDGSQIAFTQNDAGRKTDLYLLDVGTHSVRRLTNCVDASCRAPAWNPDGVRIVYERADSNRPDADSRAWIVNTRTLANTPLFIEQRWLGRAPRWSPDGASIAMYDRELTAIVLVDAVSGSRSLIQTLEDDPGEFSFDGKQLIYAQLVTTPQGVMRQTEIADFGRDPRTVRPLPPADGASVDDAAAAWSPDGGHVAIMRRYLSDERATEKFQVYDLNLRTGEAAPLVVDPAYAHGYLSWRADGAQLLMQRFPYLEPNAEPSIWVLDIRSKALTQIAVNGFMPQWLP